MDAVYFVSYSKLNNVSTSKVSFYQAIHAWKTSLMILIIFTIIKTNKTAEQIYTFYSCLHTIPYLDYKTERVIPIIFKHTHEKQITTKIPWEKLL